MLTKAPRGTKDILPDKVGNWLYLENLIRKLCGQYGYREIRTPIFEHTELFQRGIGETTDVVEKEMYTSQIEVIEALLFVLKIQQQQYALT